MAVAASRAAGPDIGRVTTPGTAAFGDMARFIARPGPDSTLGDAGPGLEYDPLAANADATTNVAVAPTGDSPTVRAAAAGRQLTAVLIADERRVAVIDDAVVSVGDVLRDGSRVSAIQPDGVWIIEKNGKWRLLTLSRGGSR